MINVPTPKRNFDVNSREDVECFKRFMDMKRWGPEGCPFRVEFPSLSIPEMIINKLIRHFLKI